MKITFILKTFYMTVCIEKSIFGYIQLDHFDFIFAYVWEFLKMKQFNNQVKPSLWILKLGNARKKLPLTP